MKLLLKRIAYAIAFVLLLIVGRFVYEQISQPMRLESLCGTAKMGETIKPFLDAVATTDYKLRTGGPSGGNEDDWFDREYLRIGTRLKQTKNISDDYTVVFAKPGVGYYACIIVHTNGTVRSAWFEDHH